MTEPRYYFVSYSHREGFGRSGCVVEGGEIHIKQAEQMLMQKDKLTDLVIISYQECSKEVLDSL